MEQLATSQAAEPGEHNHYKRPLAFLNTDVIFAYLRGDSAATQLFSAEAEGRIQFAVNPIILQQLLLTADTDTLRQFEHIQDHLQILPLDLAKAEALLPRVRAHSPFAHSNDVLIASNAGDCDFLVTTDRFPMHLIPGEKPQVVTPEALSATLQAAE